MYLDFLERYHGALQVDPKKIHISIVGWLRNLRGSVKKQRQSVVPQHTDDRDNDDAYQLNSEAPCDH